MTLAQVPLKDWTTAAAAATVATVIPFIFGGEAKALIFRYDFVSAPNTPGPATFTDNANPNTGAIGSISGFFVVDCGTPSTLPCTVTSTNFTVTFTNISIGPNTYNQIGGVNDNSLAVGTTMPNGFVLNTVPNTGNNISSLLLNGTNTGGYTANNNTNSQFHFSGDMGNPPANFYLPLISSNPQLSGNRTGFCGDYPSLANANCGGGQIIGYDILRDS